MKPRLLAISLLLVLFSMNLAQARTGDMFQVIDLDFGEEAGAREWARKGGA